MTRPFQRLGLDRVMHNVSRSIDQGGVGNVVTGDITKGAVVTVEHPGGAATEEVDVGARRTGAIMLAFDSATPTAAGEPAWAIDGSTLSVSMNTGSAAATFTFWVF